MIRLAYLAALLAGCSYFDSTPCSQIVELEEDDYQASNCLAIETHSSQPFDHVHFTLSAGLATLQPAAIVTPEMLATGESPSTDYEVYFVDPDDAFGPSRSDALDVFESADGFTSPVVVTGFSAGEVIGNGVAPWTMADGHDLGDYQYLTASVSLDTTDHVEIWGPHGWCARVVEPSETRYFVLFTDVDCDGIEDDMDATPTTFTPPTSG